MCMMATPRICWTSTLADAEEGAALPVIVDFHGGGLYYGNKENNECRDMLLARQGFAVVNANYRLVPSVSFPPSWPMRWPCSIGFATMAPNTAWTPSASA